MIEPEVHFRKRSREVRHQRRNVRSLGHLGAQELPTGRDIEEKATDLDDCSAGETRLTFTNDSSSLDDDFVAGWAFLVSGLEMEMRDRRQSMGRPLL